MIIDWLTMHFMFVWGLGDKWGPGPAHHIIYQHSTRRQAKPLRCTGASRLLWWGGRALWELSESSVRAQQMPSFVRPGCHCYHLQPTLIATIISSTQEGGEEWFGGGCAVPPSNTLKLEIGLALKLEWLLKNINALQDEMVHPSMA